jgi:hypothetical protein
VGVPYNIDTEIGVIDEGFFLDPITTHTAVLDTQRSANFADEVAGVGSADLVIGELGPSIDLDLDQTIFFTPTGIAGSAVAQLRGTATQIVTPFLIPTSNPFALSLGLGEGIWDISLLDLALVNTFRNDVNIELRPNFDYIVGSWPPAGQGLFSIDFIDDTFSLGFNKLSFADALTVTVAGGGPGPSPVPEPGTLSLLALGALGLYFSRRRRDVLLHKRRL